MRTCRNLLLRTAAILWVATLAGGSWAQTGNIAVNQTGAAADPKAILDISSTEMGLLIPRMSQAQKNAIPAPPDGLVIFQHNGPAAEPRGFYVMHEGAWTPLLQGRNGWDIWGNRLLSRNNPAPDFIGTTDNRSMMFRTNGVHRMQLDYATGYLAVGHAINTGAAGAAKERLDINGALGMYYYRGGNPPSQTAAAGVFRYQPFGTPTGPGNNIYGSYELGGISPPNAVTWGKIWGNSKFSPLMHAGHWGNISGVDTTRGGVLGTAPETITQPDLGGWRAFENPYEERFGMPWDHFGEAVCNSGTTAIMPHGWNENSNGGVMSNTIGGPDVNHVTPYSKQTLAAPMRIRKQYLFFADELNMELGQLNGVSGVTGGLCRGEPVWEIGFWVNGTTRPIAAGQAHVIVRNAPLGLDQLVGFDNSPDDSGTMGCGPITTTWPDATGAHWHMIALTTPFIWDGQSNVIVEVAVGVASGAISVNPVAVTQQAVNVTYSAVVLNTGTSIYTPLTNPYPNPGWACPNLFSPTPNAALLLPDGDGTQVQYTAGFSKWRPQIRFGGTVAGLGSITGNTTLGGRYINYPGALIMEDPGATGRINSLSPGLAWGRWRANFPLGAPTYNYKGDGTISAQKGIFDNRMRLNDHVFDRTFDGRVAPHEAAEFGGRRNLSIPEMAAFTSENRHLPTMKGRVDWDNEKGFSVGDLTNQLWATAETHALYVADLHDKLNLLEILSTDRPLNPDEFRLARKELLAMPEYNDAEKARLIAHLRQRTPSMPR